MRLHRTSLRIVVLTVVAGLAAAVPAAAGPATQTIPLQPGWNAVWLEVQPEPRDPASVFAGVPVESVWTWMERDTAMRYLQNPGEPAWNLSAWKGYRPLETDAYLSNLFAILANHAYLIKLSGTVSVDLVVTGTLVPLATPWIPDSFNLRGFPVSDTAPPTFESWFAPSPAHQGRIIYRLGPAGIWEFVDTPATTAIRRGEAYWIWCDGVSSYQGPLTVDLPGRGLNYGHGLTELTVTILNATGAERTVTLRQVAPSSPAPLAAKLFDTGTQAFTWPPLPLVFDLRAGGKRSVALAVRREAFPGESFAGTLEISDEAGTLHQVPVAAAKAQD